MIRLDAMNTTKDVTIEYVIIAAEDKLNIVTSVIWEAGGSTL